VNARAWQLAVMVALLSSGAMQRDAAAQNTFGEATREVPPQQQTPSATPQRAQPPVAQPPAAQQTPAGGFRTGSGAPAPQQGAASPGALDALMATERQNFGVAPVSALHEARCMARRRRRFPAAR
jgi:hypothetical protein